MASKDKDFDISARIKELRKQNNMQQQDLADKVGIVKKNISRWETNQVKPNLEMARDLAKALGVSLDYLVGNDDNSKNSALKSLFLSKIDKLSPDEAKALQVILNIMAT